MGVITVSIDDDVEGRFRRRLKELGNEKGAMGESITEALSLWLEKKDQEKEEWEKIMEKGLELGEIDFKRDELHER